MDASPLRKLAVELREMIWEEVLCQPTSITLRTEPVGSLTHSELRESVTTIRKHLTDVHQRSNHRTDRKKHYTPDLEWKEQKLHQQTAQLETMERRLPSLIFAPDTSQLLALTATCREIRAETIPIVYSQNEFCYSAILSHGGTRGLSHADGSEVPYLHTWLQGLGKDSRFLRKFHLDLGRIEVPRGIRMGRLCRDLAQVAAHLRGSPSLTQCTWSVTICNDIQVYHGRSGQSNQVPEADLRMALSASAIRTYLEENITAKSKLIMQSWAKKTMSHEDMGLAQSQLHEKRKYVQPFLKELAERLEVVERAEVADENLMEDSHSKEVKAIVEGKVVKGEDLTEEKQSEEAKTAGEGEENGGRWTHLQDSAQYATINFTAAQRNLVSEAAGDNHDAVDTEGSAVELRSMIHSLYASPNRPEDEADKVYEGGQTVDRTSKNISGQAGWTMAVHGYEPTFLQPLSDEATERTSERQAGGTVDTPADDHL